MPPLISILQMRKLNHPPSILRCEFSINFNIVESGLSQSPLPLTRITGTLPPFLAAHQLTEHPSSEGVSTAVPGTPGPRLESGSVSLWRLGPTIPQGRGCLHLSAEPLPHAGPPGLGSPGQRCCHPTAWPLPTLAGQALDISTELQVLSVPGGWQ